MKEQIYEQQLKRLDEFEEELEEEFESCMDSNEFERFDRKLEDIREDTKRMLDDDYLWIL